MNFNSYIEKYQKHFSSEEECKDPDFLKYMRERYDEHTSYFPTVKLKPQFKTHDPWNGVCEAIRCIPESYGCGYGFWVLINDKGKTSNGAFPIEWFDIEPNT